MTVTDQEPVYAHHRVAGIGKGVGCRLRGMSSMSVDYERARLLGLGDDETFPLG